MCRLLFFEVYGKTVKKPAGPHEGIPYLFLAFNFHEEEDPVDAEHFFLFFQLANVMEALKVSSLSRFQNRCLCNRLDAIIV